MNNVVYWSSQIFGSLGIGFLLDSKHLTRRSRAFAGWVVLFIMVFIVNIWAYFYQKSVSHRCNVNLTNVGTIVRNYTRATVSPASGYVPIDINDSEYPARVWLMIFCGLLDSMWQTASYWLMGAVSNDPAKLAYLTGFCKFCLVFIRLYTIILTFRTFRQGPSVCWCRWYLACGWCRTSVSPFVSLCCP